ncbi:MAG: DnaA regulatory inactivator Hda [Casimicrobiaceae bacterium]
MEQLVFELAEPEPPAFANFVVGANREAVAALDALAAGRLREAAVVIWGAAGAGKTHLLRATVAAAVASGRRAAFLADPAEAQPELAAAEVLVAVDSVDTADAEAQGRLFTLYNALAAAGGQFLGACARAPAQLALRDDLRTRLGYGLVYEIVPPADAQKAAALASYARSRGFSLADEVIAYLLAHGRRDMTTLVATLAALDRHSLATRRPITVPLLRDRLARGNALRDR